jgi:hypothetical protein
MEGRSRELPLGDLSVCLELRYIVRCIVGPTEVSRRLAERLKLEVATGSGEAKLGAYRMSGIVELLFRRKAGTSVYGTVRTVGCATGLRLLHQSAS